MSLSRLMAGVALVGLLAQPALAQNQGTSAKQQPVEAGAQQIAPRDMEFATKAAEGGLKEVKLGELAQQRAKTPEVQQFGRRMAEDHGKANDELRQIAQQKGIALPQELAADAQQLADELQQKSGAEFDQAYMDDMVSDHEEDVAIFKDYVKGAKDADLRSFAEQTLPTLKEHLKLARQTREQAVAMAGGSRQPAAAQPAARQTAMPAPGDVSIEKVLGTTVVNSAGESVAEVEDVVLDQDQKYYAILSVGGFLGIGEKKVAVPLDELQLGEDKTYLMSAQTEEQLKQMPEYHAEQYQPVRHRG